MISSEKILMQEGEILTFSREIILDQGIDIKKKYVAELYDHSCHVAEISVMIGIAMNLNSYELINLGIGGYLHDYGKTTIEPSILYKNDKLTNSEFQLIQGHPSFGYKELNRPPYNFDEQVLEIVLYHHEKLDGCGYPSGKNNISFLVQIVTVADMFDAIHQKRSYHKKRSIDDTISELKHSNGINQVVVKLLEKMSKEGIII